MSCLLQISRGCVSCVKDLGSRNGTFIKQRQDKELAAGDVFLLGRELFRFEVEST